MKFKLFGGLILAGVVGFLVWCNMAVVTVGFNLLDYYAWEQSLPLGILLLGTLLVGIVIGMMYMSIRGFNKKRKQKKAEQEMQKQNEREAQKAAEEREYKLKMEAEARQAAAAAQEAPAVVEAPAVDAPAAENK